MNVKKYIRAILSFFQKKKIKGNRQIFQNQYYSHITETSHFIVLPKTNRESKQIINEPSQSRLWMNNAFFIWEWSWSYHCEACPTPKVHRLWWTWRPWATVTTLLPRCVLQDLEDRRLRSGTLSLLSTWTEAGGKKARRTILLLGR